MEQKYRCEKRLLTLTFFFQHFKWQILCSHFEFVLLQDRSDRSQLIGPTCRLQIREQGVSRLFLLNAVIGWWFQPRATSLVMPMIQRREIGKDLILALGYNYFFAYHKTNKQTKTKKRKRKEKCRQDFKQVRVELLRRSDLIGIGHTGQRPWPSTQRTSTLRELTNIRGCNEPVYMTYTERYTGI